MSPADRPSEGRWGPSAERRNRKQRPAKVTTAAILLFVLAGSLLLLVLIDLKDGGTSVSALLLFAEALAVLVAGILVLRLNQAGRVLALLAASAMAINVLVNILSSDPGRQEDPTSAVYVAFVAGVFYIGLPVAIVLLLALAGKAFRRKMSEERWPPPPGQPPYGPPPHGQPHSVSPYGPSVRRDVGSETAGAALASSIVGLLCCGPVSITGLVMGHNARKEANQVNLPLNPTMNAARIIGLIAVIIWAWGRRSTLR